MNMLIILILTYEYESEEANIDPEVISEAADVINTGVDPEHVDTVEHIIVNNPDQVKPAALITFCRPKYSIPTLVLSCMDLQTLEIKSQVCQSTKELNKNISEVK